MVHAFPKGDSLKMNVIMQLKFVLTTMQAVWGTSSDEMVRKLDLLAFMSEFESHWVPSFIQSSAASKQKAQKITTMKAIQHVSHYSMTATPGIDLISW